MRKILVAAAFGLSAGSIFAAAGEFNNECAYGLSLGKHVNTDCSVSEKIDGKTYCFSSPEAKSKFMADASGNMSKAEETFGRK
jgi:YHS domain-containing protein